jgi:zinc protease
MWVGYRVPAFGAERAAALVDTAALQVVHALVFSTSSPLYQRLVVDEQKLLELSSWGGQFTRDPGLFTVDATLAQGTAFDEMIASIQHELDEVAAGHADPARVADVLSHMRYALPMGLETPEDVASLLASVIAVSGDVGALDRYLAALVNVTPADVQRVAQRYLTANRRFVVTLAHQDAPATEEGRQ